MTELIPYPETLDLRRLTRDVHKYRPEATKVDFIGTVKIHGTNITIVFRNDGSPPQIQSRNRIITPESAATDNSGAAAFLTAHLATLEQKLQRALDGALDALSKYFRMLENDLRHAAGKWKEVMIAGEWAGQGIQKGVGVNQCERFYIIFGMRVDGLWMPGEVWRSMRVEEARIFNILDFQTFKVTIDFTDYGAEGDCKGENTDGSEIETVGGIRDGVVVEEPEPDQVERYALSANSDVEKMTQAVEDECPVALKVGGVRNGVGEGIVWVEESDVPVEHALRFKSKGPKHQISGRKVPKQLSLGQDAKKHNAERFVAYAVPDVRLREGLESLREQSGAESVLMILLDKKNIPKVHKWIMADVAKEEEDVMLEMGLTVQDVRTEVMRKVRSYFETGAEAEGSDDR